MIYSSIINRKKCAQLSYARSFNLSTKSIENKTTSKYHIIPSLNTHSGTLAQSSDSPQSPTVQKSETSPFSESPQSMSLLSNSKYFLSLAVEKVRFRSIALDLKEKVSYNLAYEHVL